MSKHWWWLVGALALVVGLALRLVVWRWHTFYPLGGDEQEYLNQALTLLQDRRYDELRLMRPPLYGVFLAGCIVLVDSLVQNLRLVQVFLSTATIVPMWLLAAELARQEDVPPSRRLLVPALAAWGCGLSYTLAAHATELLTETLFLLGLTVVLWLLVRAGRADTRRYRLVALAGVGVGVLCLVRSVALPLLPLGALWLVACSLPPAPRLRPPPRPHLAAGARLAAVFVGCALLCILPWTARNSVEYGGLILVDTTGAENLWLDNDPAGREAVKAHLYALGDDRLARQQLATQRGIATIAANPQYVAGKAWRELQAFFALEYTDDMLARPVIWVPPLEVWARLVLGDGLFLLVLLCGVAGLWRRRQNTPLVLLHDPRWFLGAWALYTVFTAALFHVELRYRLPLFPVLLPYAALWLVTPRAMPSSSSLSSSRLSRLRRVAGTVLHPALLIVCLMLLYRPYPLLAWHTGWKHAHVASANAALEQGNTTAARESARAALLHDGDSVLARVALARAALLDGEPAQAETWLHEAIASMPDHPLPHLLLGDVLRRQGDTAGARLELRYETATLQDVQTWCWQHCTTPPPARLDVGNGLDLGMVQGMYLAAVPDAPEASPSYRWTTVHARLRLTAPPGASVLWLRMASGRPPAAPPPTVTVSVNGQTLAQVQAGVEWQVYTFALPALPPGMDDTTPLVIDLHSDTFTPREYDPASSDGRTLGVMLDWAAVGEE